MQTQSSKSSTRAGIRWLTRAASIAACCAAPLASPAAPSFITFDTGHVRPLALSADGSTLFTVNTPNGTLVVYDVNDRGLIKKAEVSVGMEPVAVAVRNDDEVWVVNHLSDSVSIVSLRGTPRVTQTLLVGDEPRDIVFAGQPARAFITTAHRGQHRTDPSIATVPGAGDPQLTTPSIGRADVWVFDPVNLGNNSLGGIPVKIMSFFSDTPRALAVSPDRRTVYVAAFKSGNQTTTVPAYLPCYGTKPDVPCTSFGVPVPGGIGVLGPTTNIEGKPTSANGFVMKFNNTSGHWEDQAGRIWDSVSRFTLPDLDVFSIDTDTLTQKAAFAHVGTALFNMVTNPKSGKLYISNTDSVNHLRFEGPGNFAGSTVQGHHAEARITVISGNTVSPRHLNKHINYSILANDPGFDPTIKNHSLATPLDMVVSRNGQKLYVAAFGSGKIGVYDTGELEANTFNPTTASAGHIRVSGGGPSGLALDEHRNRLYVLTRFDNSVKVIDLATKREVAASAMFNPEPPEVVAGRPILYDALATSANGEASCSSCHIFGDNDDLAWDLGNPDDIVTTNPIPLNGIFLIEGETPINGSGVITDFHPMKGVMATQTLRGLRNHGAMHWRGDRSVGLFGTDPFDAEVSFNNFIGAFQSLLGRATPITVEQMRKFTAFQLNVELPPNPNRNLDNSLSSAQQRASDFFRGPRPSISFPPVPGTGGDNLTCEGCHRLDPAQGFFGTDGRASSVFEPITFKVPHLRNLYTKVGMFGLVAVPLFFDPDAGHMSDQVRGFGFVHDATIDTLFHFNGSLPFLPTATTGLPVENTTEFRRDLEHYLLRFETDLAPIVGQQVTLTSTNATAVSPRIDLLQQRAAASFTSKNLGGTVTECGLVARVNIAGQPRSFLYDTRADAFVREDKDHRRVAIPSQPFRQIARIPGQETTFTCAPPGSGFRMTAAR